MYRSRPCSVPTRMKHSKASKLVPTEWSYWKSVQRFSLHFPGTLCGWEGRSTLNGFTWKVRAAQGRSLVEDTAGHTDWSSGKAEPSWGWWASGGHCRMGIPWGTELPSCTQRKYRGKQHKPFITSWTRRFPMLSIRTQLLLVDQRSKVTWGGVQNQRNQPKRCSGVNNIKGKKKKKKTITA